MPLDTSSATFTSPGICFHWSGSELLCISPILVDTNVLNDLACERIHANTIMLSRKYTTFSNWNLDSSAMVFPRRVANTAACNSSLGIVSCFKGATLDFAAISVN